MTQVNDEKHLLVRNDERRECLPFKGPCGGSRCIAVCPFR